MPFKKGRTKTGGIKKGTKHTSTILLENRRDEAYALLDNVLIFVKSELDSNDNERIYKALDVCAKYLPFVLPKLSSVDATVDTKVNISSIKFEDA